MQVLKLYFLQKYTFFQNVLFVGFWISKIQKMGIFPMLM